MKKKYTPIIFLCILILVFGCKKSANLTEKVPLGNDYIAIKMSDKQKEHIKHKSSFNMLRFDEAIELTLEMNNELKTKAYEIMQKDGLIIQSKLWKNPEVSLALDGLSGNSESEGMEAEVTVSQVFQLGNKIKKNVKVAQVEKDIAIQEVIAHRSSVLAETALRYLEVAKSQSLLSELEKNNEIALEVYQMILKSEKAGDKSPLESKKANLTYTSNVIEIARLKNTLSQAKIRLANMWGSQKVNFESVEFTSKDIVLFEQVFVEKELMKSPFVLAELLKKSLEEERVKLEEAKAIPDVTIEVGYKNYEESKNDTFSIGFSMPLPFFDRNQGMIKVAKANNFKSLKAFENTINKVKFDLAELFLKYKTDQEYFNTLKSDLHSSAETVYKDTLASYKSGAVNLITVLDSQRDFFRIKAEMIEFEYLLLEHKVNILKVLGMSPHQLFRNN